MFAQVAGIGFGFGLGLEMKQLARLFFVKVRTPTSTNVAWDLEFVGGSSWPINIRVATRKGRRDSSYY
jgi:hypothetical protein